MALDPLADNSPPPLTGVTVDAPPASATAREKLSFLRSGWAQFKRLTEISFPRRFPIVQFPNAPLILAFLAGVLAGQVHGLTRSYAQAAAYLAMTVWAYEEAARGVNWFRRLLGLAYMIIMVTRVAHGLHA